MSEQPVPSDYRPLLPTLRNEAFDRALREQLRVLRDHAPRDLARRIDDVLEGRRSLRGLAESDEMGKFMEPLVHRGLAERDRLSTEEQDDAARGLREEYGDPSLRHGGRAAAPEA